MRKILKSLSLIVVFPIMLLVNGCFMSEISDEKGKQWAEENGYIKDEQYPVVGKYNFEYVFFGEDDGTGYRVNSCSALSGLPSNSTVSEMMEACQDKYSTKIEITENGMFKVTEPDKTTTWQYLVNEKGELLVSPLETNVQNSAIKDVYYNIDAYKLENGRIYLSNLSLGNGIEVVGVYKK